MEYSKIVSVTGLPGLFEILSNKSDGAIVRSLEDKATKFVSSRVHNLSHLESIEVYTNGENVNLVDVFKAMESKGSALPAEKDAKAVKSYFEKVFPELDFERVYNSDMKKMIRWYQILKANNVEIKLTEYTDEELAEDTPSAEPVVEEVTKPKSTRAKKAKTEE
ncbi:MAG: DUF5606 domain-containing protein [Sphingobacteriales bacterium]|jgi:hypothetical protein